MTQLKHSPETLAPVSIVFADGIISTKAEIIPFSPVLTATYASDKEKIIIDELLADIQPVSFDALSTVFVILEAIYTTLTPRQDGGYIAQQVQLIANDILTDKSELLLSHVCLIAHALNIPLLLNASIGTIFSNPDVIGEIREFDKFDSYLMAEALCFYKPANGKEIAQILSTIDFVLFSDPFILKLLEKHYLLRNNRLQELSIADYIALYGEPSLMDHGLLNMGLKSLTSLYGIDQITNKENITCLYLANNLLASSIETEDNFSFAGFTKLVALDLADNGFNTLPLSLFKNFASLKILSLINNQLTTLDPIVFQKLTHLETLWLSRNYIETLPGQLFNNLVHLKVLYLNNNGLKYLDPLLFQGLSELETLDLSHNRLTALPDTLFKGLQNLYSLSLNNNEIEHLAITPFYELSSNKMIKNIVLDEHNREQLLTQLNINYDSSVES